MGASARDSMPGAPDLTAARVSAVLEAAAQFETGVKLDALADLLIAESLRSPEDLSQWLGAFPDLARVHRGTAFHPTVNRAEDQLELRRMRGGLYTAAARAMVARWLRPVLSVVRTVAVTGSTAYGEPDEDDDCDFMVVVRDGALWAFLVFTFLRLRLWAERRKRPGAPTWCFNYVVDESTVHREFARPQGFLFAREALMAKPIFGEAYYRSLIGKADWLREETPRLYARWEADGFPPTPASRPVAWPVRLGNALVFPWASAYLQLKGLWRDRTVRSSGAPEGRFRTVTRFGRMALETVRFDRLIQGYSAGDRIPREPAPRAGSSVGVPSGPTQPARSP
jgi:hypothetical protein